MRFETIEQIKKWIETNLDYFWSHEANYFILDLSQLPFETDNLGKKFKTGNCMDEMHRLGFKFKKHVFIDLKEKYELYIELNSSVKIFNVDFNKLVEKKFLSRATLDYSLEEIYQSLHDFEKWLA